MYTPASSTSATPLAQRLMTLGAELHQWRVFWSSHAFRDPVLAWESDSPELSRALRGLDAPAVAALNADSSARDAFLGRWFPVERWAGLEQIGIAAGTALRPWPRDFDRDIPGRKWAQVKAFAGALASSSVSRTVDWCAGKAHLGRALACQWQGSEVLALERDPALVEAALGLARRDGVRLDAQRCDVLSGDASAIVAGEVRVVALHACGALHRRLFDVASAAGTRALACAPCCFHLGEEGHRPRSAAGGRANPGLAPEDLRTAVQEVVTSGAHDQRRREHVQSWQLGFDALLREGLGHSAYTAVPGASAALLGGGFASYCRHAARLKGLTLAADIDFPQWEARGRARFLEVSALDLVRQRFRRLIELWLVTDLAVSLEESGYAVRLERFCAPALSPRNLLLQAERRA
jgi:hypothetical protein